MNSIETTDGNETLNHTTTHQVLIDIGFSPEEVSIILALYNEDLNFGPKLEETELRYEFFSDPDGRNELYEGFKRLADYLHQNKISNVMFLDRAARPAYAALRTYMAEKYPKEELNTYFLNPILYAKGDEHLQVTRALGDKTHKATEDKLKELDKRFPEVYRKLSDEKDKPLMLFDTCIHSGTTMYQIIQSLKRQGFQDVKIGVFHFDDKPYPFLSPEALAHLTSRLQPDFIMSNYQVCQPFGTASLVKKDEDIVSRKLESDEISKEEFEASYQIRRELIQIMKDGFKRDEMKSVDRIAKAN